MYGSLNRVRVALVMGAGRTRQLVKVQSLFSCIPLILGLLLNPPGHRRHDGSFEDHAACAQRRSAAS